MTLIDLQQNTPEWHAWRKNLIMASELPSIMGVSPFRTELQLWEEKLGLRNVIETDAMKWGKDNEELARQSFIDSFGVCVQPGCFQRDFMGASLDGISEDRSIVIEIKCPTSRNTKDWELAKRGVVPEKYYPQLQAQCYVVGVDEIIYYHYNVLEKTGIPIVIKRDDSYIETLLCKAKAFYDCLLNLESPKGTEADFQEIEFEPCRQDVDRYMEITMHMKYLEQEKERLRKNITNYCKELGINGKVNDIKISQRCRKGQINYTDIPQLFGVDLEKYRKSNSVYWQIS